MHRQNRKEMKVKMEERLALELSWLLVADRRLVPTKFVGKIIFFFGLLI